MTSIAPDEPGSVQTQPALLKRLKSGDDSKSWDDFYRIYGKLVRDFALQAGLTAAEADDATQETMIGIARNLPDYEYDPKVCRFKTWLLNQTSWRIKDQLKKRKKAAGWGASCEEPRGEGARSSDDTSTATAAINRVPDPASVDLDALFEEQWRRKQFELALERMKEKFSLKQFQAFDLLVNKEWPAADVAKALSVTLANVYVTRHRISAAIKKEIKHIERQFERAARGGETKCPPQTKSAGDIPAKCP